MLEHSEEETRDIVSMSVMNPTRSLSWRTKTSIVMESVFEHRQ